MSPGYTMPPNKNIFYEKVWEIARQIPYGKVTTYGRIAAMISPPNNISPRAFYFQSPRWVGSAMASCPNDVPWHRVINSKGKISIRKSGDHILQKRLLEEEGVKFNKNQEVNLSDFGWPLP